MSECGRGIVVVDFSGLQPRISLEISDIDISLHAEPITGIALVGFDGESHAEARVVRTTVTGGGPALFGAMFITGVSNITIAHNTFESNFPELFAFGVLEVLQGSNDNWIVANDFIQVGQRGPTRPAIAVVDLGVPTKDNILFYNRYGESGLPGFDGGGAGAVQLLDFGGGVSGNIVIEDDFPEGEDVGSMVEDVSGNNDVTATPDEAKELLGEDLFDDLIDLTNNP